MKSPNLDALAKVIPHLNRVGIAFGDVPGLVTELPPHGLRIDRSTAFLSRVWS